MNNIKMETRGHILTATDEMRLNWLNGYRHENTDKNKAVYYYKKALFICKECIGSIEHCNLLTKDIDRLMTTR